VEALLRRRSGDDLEEAKLAIDRFAAVPTDPGSVLHEIWRLRMRALLARACGDEAGYKELAHSYLTMATELGFEGHMKWAEAMP
jgi:adenylate cyclase